MPVIDIERGQLIYVLLFTCTVCGLCGFCLLVALVGLVVVNMKKRTSVCFNMVEWLKMELKEATLKCTGLRHVCWMYMCKILRCRL